MALSLILWLDDLRVTGGRAAAHSRRGGEKGEQDSRMASRTTVAFTSSSPNLSQQDNKLHADSSLCSQGPWQTSKQSCEMEGAPPSLR